MNAPAKVEKAKPDARQMFEESAREGLIEDVTAISRAVRYIEVAPVRMFDASLLSELADASDRLAAKVADLQERTGASR